MTATKTNERPGTRAVLHHEGVSASKVRAVLGLIRGLDVRTADEVLRYSERGAAVIVRKLLASAVANAAANDSLDSEELYVATAYADEAKTLRRFRPRARGRAARIRKRSCHVTIIVARMSEAELTRRRAKDAIRPGSRAARVAAQQATDTRRRRRRSRQAETTTHDHDDHDHDGHDHDGHDHDEPDQDTAAPEETDAEAPLSQEETASSSEGASGHARDEAEEAVSDGPQEADSEETAEKNEPKAKTGEEEA